MSTTTEEDNMSTTTEDYPFDTWEGYYAALAESLNTEMYDDTYPEYGEFCDSEGCEADLSIIQDLLYSDESPQEGFDQLLKTCIINNRYSDEFVHYKTFRSILQAFFDNHVHLNIDILLNIYLANSSQNYYDAEDECHTCYVRASIIEALIPFVPDILTQLNDKIQWDTITPIDWEESEIPTTLDQLPPFIYAVIKYYYLSLDCDE